MAPKLARFGLRSPSSSTEAVPGPGPITAARRPPATAFRRSRASRPGLRQAAPTRPPRPAPDQASSTRKRYATHEVLDDRMNYAELLDFLEGNWQKTNRGLPIDHYPFD